MSTFSSLQVQSALENCVEQSSRHPEAARLALLRTRPDAALREAAAHDVLLNENSAAAPLAGAILTVKSCFDVAGWVTHAGSQILADRPAATCDARLVAQLRQAGAVLVAQTNMTEFAYGALGLNPWYGTPTTPLMDTPCVAGGSSSGAAVATALGMGDLAVGSDTSGSVRIPAAFCGIAGFKPSRARYSDAGLMHLSPSFDAPGLLADTLALCHKADRAMRCSNRSAPSPSPALSTPPIGLQGLRLLVPDDWFGPLLDDDVGRAFEQWVKQLSTAGAQLHSISMPMLARSGQIASEGGIIAVEAYRLHAQTLADNLSAYDPRVGSRMMLGAQVKAHVYEGALAQLQTLALDYDSRLQWADAVVTPTVPMLPPTLASLQDDDAYMNQNRRAYQLTEFANRLDLPAVSLPGDLNRRQPIGLQLVGRRNGDSALLDLAERVECALTRA